MANRNNRKLGRFVFSIVVLYSGVSVADTRIDYLIKMLEHRGNYRLRVQAATTLGTLRSKEAVPALTRALSDEHELVVISVASALGRIGDPSVVKELEKLRKKTKRDGVKSQVEATLRILKALDHREPVTPKPAGPPRFLVRVDPMGNASGVNYDGLLDTFHRLVVNRVMKEPDVVIQPDSMSNKGVKKRIKKEKLSGYVVSGSLIQLEKQADHVRIRIGLNVMTNPEYSLLMMPTVGGTVPFSRNDSDKQAYEKAIQGVVDKLVKMVFDKLRDM